MKTLTDTQMKFYKAVARPTLLYGSETWVTTERDMTGLAAAEMRFLTFWYPNFFNFFSTPCM
jgi:hypothetical protein